VINDEKNAFGKCILVVIKKQHQVVFKREQHRDQTVLSLYMPKDDVLNGIAKGLNAKYSVTKKMWHLPYSKASVNKEFEAFKDVAWVDYSAIQTNRHVERNEMKPRHLTDSSHSTGSGQATTQASVGMTKTAWTPEQKQAMWAYAEKLKVRRYSQNTYNTYGSLFKAFLGHFQNHDPKDITEQQIRTYLKDTVEKNRYSHSTQNQIINAIKFYYEQVLGLQKKKYWIDRPRSEQRLPTVLSEEEIVRMLVAVGNIKHQCIIGMLYSSGIRRGELINLRISDIDIDRKQVFVRGGKGKKDRMTLLSDRMTVALQKYMLEWKPNYWMFEGPERKQYSPTSVGHVVKGAARKAGIKKNVSPHVLRHSFATHLMEKGTDTRYIQELLGHSSLETTAIYAHVSKKNLQNIISPLDRIFMDNALKNNKLKP
jgi:integrase/recombinase XerD